MYRLHWPEKNSSTLLTYFLKMKPAWHFVQFIDVVDNLINSIKLYCSVWNEIKNWIELNYFRLWLYLFILFITLNKNKNVFALFFRIFKTSEYAWLQFFSCNPQLLNHILFMNRKNWMESKKVLFRGCAESMCV